LNSYKDNAKNARAHRASCQSKLKDLKPKWLWWEKELNK
jgi:hypothetical protein